MNAPSIQLKPKSQRSYIYLVSKIAAAFLNLLSISLFTRILDVQLYGNYLLYSSYVTLICSLLFWWHRLSVYRYYHKYEKYSNSYLNFVNMVENDVHKIPDNFSKVLEYFSKEINNGIRLEESLILKRD